MILPIIIALLLALLGGFMLLVAFEAKREIRFLGGLRSRADRAAARFAFILRHVDWAAFAKHSVQSFSTYLAHEAAHGTLIAVRFLERSLTRAVRALREHHRPAQIAQERPTLRERVNRFRTARRAPAGPEREPSAPDA